MNAQPPATRGARAGAQAGTQALPSIETWRAAFSRRVQYALLALAMRRQEAGEDGGTRLKHRELVARLNDVLQPEKDLIPETVRKWVAGITTPDPVAILALSRVLGVDPGWLTYGGLTTAEPHEEAPLGAAVAAKTVRATSRAVKPTPAPAPRKTVPKRQ